MHDLIETIRTALVTDASDEARAAGALACRTILTALDRAHGANPEPSGTATPGPESAPMPEPPKTAEPDPAPAPPPPVPPAVQIAALIGAMRGLPAEQLLDLAIARVRAALPQGVTAPTAPTAQPVRFQIVPLPSILTRTKP